MGARVSCISAQTSEKTKKNEGDFCLKVPLGKKQAIANQEPNSSYCLTFNERLTLRRLLRPFDTSSPTSLPLLPL